MVTTCRRGDEMPCLAKFSRRPSTAGLKHLTRQDCDRCCVKSRMADSVRLITGVSPGRSWNFASRSGPLMTAVVRWSMPQLCPKITSLPAQSPYILFKRSRAASCGSGSSEPSSGSCFVANCQQPAQQPALPQGIAGRPAVLAMAGQRSPVAEVADRLAAARSPTAHKPRRGAVRLSSPQPSSAYCPFRTNRTNYPSQCSPRAPLSEGGVSQLTRCRPRASLDWTRAPPRHGAGNTTACTALPMPSAPC
jgi:hypothetical protein